MGALEIRAWKMKNLHQKLMLGLSSLVSICVLCACWALLMEGAISRLVTNGLDLLSDVLKEEVMRQVERMQMELEHCSTLLYIRTQHRGLSMSTKPQLAPPAVFVN